MDRRNKVKGDKKLRKPEVDSALGSPVSEEIRGIEPTASENPPSESCSLFDAFRKR